MSKTLVNDRYLVSSISFDSLSIFVHDEFDKRERWSTLLKFREEHGWKVKAQVTFEIYRNMLSQIEIYCWLLLYYKKIHGIKLGCDYDWNVIQKGCFRIELSTFITSNLEGTPHLID